VTGKRPDEEFCREAYTRYLQATCPFLEQKWVPGDRPDYRLTSAVCVAIEVTSIFEQVKVGSRLYPRIALIESASRLVREAEHRAVAQGILSGTYSVRIDAVEGFAELREPMIEAIVQYIAGTQAVSRGAESPLLPNTSQGCAISKVGADGADVRLVWDGDAHWEADMEAEIGRLVEAAVHKKSVLLSHLDEPIVLLILDRYHLADAATWRRATAQLTLPNGFVEISRVCDNGVIQVLKSVASA